MAIPISVKRYLFNCNVRYFHRTHQPAYSSQRVAEVERVSGDQFAKTVIVKTEQGLIMAVLPGDHILSLEALQSFLGCETLTLATEKEFVGKFPNCEPGAMPPFGTLFRMPLFCDKALSKHDEIEFNAGTHMDAIRMKFADFMKIEKPVLLDFSEKCTGERFARTA